MFLLQTPRRPRLPVIAIAAVALLLGTGCETTGLPCLEYTAQTYTRTISMRSYGSVQVEEQTMVCTQRASPEQAPFIASVN